MRPGTIVLLVEDDAATRDGYAEFLAAVGLYVVEASNSLEALDVIARTMPDIIVTDLTMSPTDRLQLCERLRSDPRTREIPVIVVTGNDDDGVLHRAMESGLRSHTAQTYPALGADPISPNTRRAGKAARGLPLRLLATNVRIAAAATPANEVSR